MRRGGREESKRSDERKSKAVVDNTSNIKSDDHSLSTKHIDGMDYTAFALE